MSPFRLPPVLGQQLESFRCFDFSGGLDVQTEATKLALLKTNRRLTLAKNALFRTDGSVETRTGTEMVCRATTLKASGDIQGGVHYRTSGGVDQVIVAINGNLYKVTSTTAVTSIKSGLTSTRRYFFAIYNDVLLIANGTDAPMQYDGTTVTALAGSSPATLHVVVIHGNRAFGTATAVPSRLYWSKLNNTLDWSGTTDAGFMDVNPNDGGTIKDLVPAIQELVILKQNRPYRLQGIGPATGYTVVDNLVPTVSSVGCQWPGAACFAGNEVWFASREGLHTLGAVTQFGDLDVTYASRPVEPYFRSAKSSYLTEFNPFSTGTGLTNALAVQLVHNPGNDTLVLGTTSFAASTRGSWDRFLVYDRNAKAWATWNLGLTATATAIQATAMWPYTDATTGRHTLMVGCVDPTDDLGGYVVKLTDPDGAGDLSSDATSAGSTDTFVTVVEHVSCLGAPNVLKTPRHLFLYFKQQSSGSVDVEVYYDFLSTATVTASTVSLTSTLDANRGVIIKRLDLSGECEFLALRISSPASGPTRPWRFLGYEVQYRAKRTVRRAE